MATKKPPVTKTNLTPFYIIIGVLATLMIAFGVLWALQFFGPDYKAKSQQATKAAQVLSDSLRSVNTQNASYREQLGLPLATGFEVQLGFFKEYDLSAMDENLVQFGRFYDDNGVKFVLGRFQSLGDAQNMVQELRGMGITDAFIAGVVDGERTTVAAAKKAAKSFY